MLYIVSHTEVQFDRFLRQHNIARTEARRVRTTQDVRGIQTSVPLVLLPGWQELGREADEIFAVWHHRGGEVHRVTEPKARGEQPLCVHDTDGDGDCHLCHRKGGCQWPHNQ